MNVREISKIMPPIVKHTLKLLGTGFFCLTMGGVSPVFGEETQDAILQELKEIRKLLEENLKRGGIGRPQAPPAFEKLEGVSVGIEADPFKGSPTAKVTIVEFSDYQCPFCARHVKETLPLLEKDYIQPGLVKYVFRDFPLDDLHPTARALAVGASCAGEQQKYWDMHDFLFANQKDLGPRQIEAHAESLGIRMEEFQSCVTRESVQQEIQQDVQDGQKLGLNGTPSFFLGVDGEDGENIQARYIFRGALPYAEFKKIIDGLLNES